MFRPHSADSRCSTVAHLHAVLGDAGGEGGIADVLRQRANADRAMKVRAHKQDTRVLRGRAQGHADLVTGMYTNTDCVHRLLDRVLPVHVNTSPQRCKRPLYRGRPQI